MLSVNTTSKYIPIGNTTLKFFSNDIVTIHEHYNKLEKSTKVLVITQLKEILEKELIHINMVV